MQSSTSCAEPPGDMGITSAAKRAASMVAIIDPICFRPSLREMWIIAVPPFSRSDPISYVQSSRRIRRQWVAKWAFCALSLSRPEPSRKRELLPKSRSFAAYMTASSEGITFCMERLTRGMRWCVCKRKS
jgi:hypothetical protein